MRKCINLRANIALGLVFAFLLNIFRTTPSVQAFELQLPAPGTIVNLSSNYVPVVMKGMRIHPDNPLLFDFILDTGNSGLKSDSATFKQESQKLINYFLAALTIKEDDLWVNLSPYEKDRIVPKELGVTQMGRDMLAEDYILKQLTASLIYPEKDLGKKFWDTVYTKARQMYGTATIPVNTFNKVWIVADKAKIVERNNTAYIVGAHLKVMLEEDYLALKKHSNINGVIPAKAGIHNKNNIHAISSQLIRQIILPQLEEEVNQGQNFVVLRQMFYSMILATWYKLAIKDALLNQVYSDRGKTGGVLSNDPTSKAKIYEQYLRAYKKGVFNYIKRDVDGPTQQIIPRRYFSGGLALNISHVLDLAMTVAKEDHISPDGNLAMVTVGMRGKSDTAPKSSPAMLCQVKRDKDNNLLIRIGKGMIRVKTSEYKKGKADYGRNHDQRLSEYVINQLGRFDIEAFEYRLPRYIKGPHSDNDHIIVVGNRNIFLTESVTDRILEAEINFQLLDEDIDYITYVSYHFKGPMNEQALEDYLNRHNIDHEEVEYAAKEFHGTEHSPVLNNVRIIIHDHYIDYLDVHKKLKNLANDRKCKLFLVTISFLGRSLASVAYVVPNAPNQAMLTQTEKKNVREFASQIIKFINTADNLPEEWLVFNDQEIETEENRRKRIDEIVEDFFSAVNPGYYNKKFFNNVAKNLEWGPFKNAPYYGPFKKIGELRLTPERKWRVFNKFRFRNDELNLIIKNSKIGYVFPQQKRETVLYRSDTLTFMPDFLRHVQGDEILSVDLVQRTAEDQRSIMVLVGEKQDYVLLDHESFLKYQSGTNSDRQTYWWDEYYVDQNSVIAGTFEILMRDEIKKELSFKVMIDSAMNAHSLMMSTDEFEKYALGLATEIATYLNETENSIRWLAFDADLVQNEYSKRKRVKEIVDKYFENRFKDNQKDFVYIVPLTDDDRTDETMSMDAINKVKSHITSHLELVILLKFSGTHTARSQALGRLKVIGAPEQISIPVKTSIIKRIVNKFRSIRAPKEAKSHSDSAMNGGIDLNAKNMELGINHLGGRLKMNFDPAMMAEFRKGNFTGVEGLILKIVPIESPLPFLGLA